MIFVSPSVVMTRQAVDLLMWPVFLWNNVVDITGIASNHEDPNYPATNLWNPQTSSVWKSAYSAGATTLTFTLDGLTEIDSIGIARHNFGSGSIAVEIQGLNGDVGAVYETLAEINPGDDTPILAIVDADYYIGIKIILTPISVAPQAAHVAIGPLLKMSIGIPPGHIPIKDALSTDMLNNESENGEFLGDIITSQRLTTTVQFKLIDGLWYRNNMRAFVQARQTFFFGWAPITWPNEMGFAKFTNSPMPTINQSTGEMDIALQLVGLAL